MQINVLFYFEHSSTGTQTSANTDAGLAKATMLRGHDVLVVLPYYSCLPSSELVDLKHIADIDCPKGKVWDGELQLGTLRTAVHTAVVDGIPVMLIGPSDRGQSNIFNCDRIYGGSYSEIEAYLYFCRCVVCCGIQHC